MTLDAIKINKWLLILIAAGGLLVSGCRTSIRSPNEYAADYVGSPMERLLTVVDRNHARDPKKVPSRDDLLKTRYLASNGNTIYIDPANFKRCNIHWEVNHTGIIVGYRFEEVLKSGCNW